MSEKINDLEQNFNSQINNIEKKLKTLEKNIDDAKSDLSSTLQQIKENIKAQNEVTKDIINKHEETLTKELRKFSTDLEEIKREHDILKISYTVNEKKLLEKIELMIYSEVRNACNEKEREILMNLWIKDLKEIISDFEKLKKMHPKEFTLKLDEIASTITLFKQKLK